MGNNKSLPIRCPINYAYLKVYPYGANRVYFELIEVEYLLLMNNIFLMDGVFSVKHNWYIHLYESGSGVVSYENLDRFSEALMNI